MKNRNPKEFPAWVGYSLSILAVAAAVGLRLLLDPWMGQTGIPYITFNAALAVVAFLWGRGPGISATILGGFACVYFIIPPRHEIHLGNSHVIVPLALFLGTGLLVSILAGRLRATRELARQQSEAATAAADTLQVTLNSIGDAVLATDTAGRVTFLNPAAASLTGWSAQEAAGEPIGRVFKLINEHTRQAGEDLVSRVLAEKRLVAMANHTALVARDGRETPIEDSAAPIMDAAGRLTGVVIVFHDVAEKRLAQDALRESEQRLSYHVDNSPLAVIEWGTDMRLTRWSGEAERMFGWKADEVLGKRIEDFRWIYEQDVKQVADVTTALHDGSDARRFSANRNYCKDGSVVDCEWYNSSLLDESGKLQSILSLVLNVTQRRQAEQALTAAKNNAEQAKAEAEHASRAKDHFLAVLSHELRTPLSPVLATVSMLEQRPGFDADTRELLELIHRNVELEARLIDDLLDVTRISRGKLELDKRPVSLSTVIRRAVEVCVPDIEARKLRFHLDLGAAAPYFVQADPARLQQVFWNLLRNAVKFTPEGGSVIVRCRDDGDRTAIVEITDTGIGIDPEAMDRIFNAFEQAERSLTRQFGGLGLGLTISKAMVELHGGQIDARSDGRDQGATFTVRLPICDAQQEVPPEASPLAPSDAASTPEARKLRILLVEDHGDTAKVMKRLLVGKGHEVETAADVATALKLAGGTGHDPFDLMLSDLGLPDGSGLDLMRTLRKLGRTTPAIAISGYGQEQDINQSREAGFAAHITKPVNLRQLQETIRLVTSPVSE